MELFLVLIFLVFVWPRIKSGARYLKESAKRKERYMMNQEFYLKSISESVNRGPKIESKTRGSENKHVSNFLEAKEKVEEKRRLRRAIEEELGINMDDD